MNTLDTDFVRSQFPAFSEPALDGFLHFDNAGGSYACHQVIDQLQRYYRQTKVQPDNDYPASRAATEQMKQARRRMAAWLNVAEDEVHFGPSTSQNTYVVAQALRTYLDAGDEVIVTNQDHEANVGAWRRLAESGVVVREWQVDPASGELDPAGLDALLTERTRVVAFTHCSNIIGSINPVRALTDRIHEAGALAFVDGVAFCPHGLPDVTDLGADLYTFSLYKVYGPHLGVMVMRRALNESLPSQGHFFNEGRPGARFTPAGPDHAQIAAVNGVIDYCEAVDRHHGGGGTGAAERVAGLFRQQEQALLPPLLDFISSHPRTRLFGKDSAHGRAPTVSFAIEGQGAPAVASKLGREQAGVGVGHCYAYRLIQALGLDPAVGVLRTSFVHYTTESEVKQLIELLDRHL